MNSLIKIMPNFKKFNEYMQDVKNNVNPIMLSGLSDTGKVHLSYATSFYAEKPICIITYNEMQAKKLLKDFQYFTQNVVFFPKKEIITYDYIAESKDTYFDRIEVLNKIHDKKADVIITTIEAATQKIIAEKTLYKNTITLKIGEELPLEELKQKLIQLGYERYENIEGKGQFSVRGRNSRYSKFYK